MQMKNLFYKIALLISGMAFWVLSNCFSQNLSGARAEMTMNVILAAAFSIFVIFLPAFFLYQRIKLRYVLCGGVINLCLTANFLYRWMASTQIQGLADRIGMSKNDFVTGGSLLLGVLAVFFTAVLLQWLWEGTEEPVIGRVDRILSGDRFFVFCLVDACICVLVSLVCSFSCDIWFDEAFSLAMVKHSYAEIITFTASDVHPPLYYMILKFFTDGVHMFFQEASSVFVAKIVSLIPHMILLTIAAGKLRKEWGNYIAGVFALSVVGMPALLIYSIEIRMYSWGLLFVTSAYLGANDIIRKNRKTDWVQFVLLSLSAAYTHYFACLAVSVSYIMLFLWFLVNDRKRIKAWFAATIATVAGYLPWLLIFLRQAQTVSGNYWIPDITFGTFINYLCFMAGSPFGFIILILLLVSGIMEAPLRKTDGWQSVFAIMGILTPVLTAFTGTVLSILIRPILVARYMIPGLGCLWIGSFILSEQQRNKKYKVLLAVLVVLTSAFQTVGFGRYEREYRIQSEKTIDFLDRDDAAYVVDDVLALATMKEMAPTEMECYFWQCGFGPEFSRVFGNVESFGSSEEIKGLLRNGKSVYYFNCAKNITIDDVIQESGLIYVDMGEYRIPENMIKIYQIMPE